MQTLRDATCGARVISPSRSSPRWCRRRIEILLRHRRAGAEEPVLLTDGRPSGFPRVWWTLIRAFRARAGDHGRGGDGPGGVPRGARDRGNETALAGLRPSAWAMLRRGARPAANHAGDSCGRGAQRSTIDPGSVSSSARFSLGRGLPVGRDVRDRHARSAGPTWLHPRCAPPRRYLGPVRRGAGANAAWETLGDLGRRCRACDRRDQCRIDWTAVSGDCGAPARSPTRGPCRVRGAVRICRRSLTRTAAIT